MRSHGILLLLRSWLRFVQKFVKHAEMNARSMLNTMNTANAVRKLVANAQKLAEASHNFTKKPTGNLFPVGFFFSQALFCFINPFVADAPNGKEMVIDGKSRLPDLFAHIPHVRIDCPSFRFRIESPDQLDQLVPAENFAWILQQLTQHEELFRCQLDELLLIAEFEPVFVPKEALHFNAFFRRNGAN